MRLSVEPTEKFEIELVNEQVKKIRQAINDCQLRFGKVLGCGTCKSLQLCTWIKELSNTIESMGKHIEALQQENEQIKESFKKYGDIAVQKGFLLEEVNLDNVRRLQQENEQLRAQVATAQQDYHNPIDVETLKQAREALEFYANTQNYFSVGDVPDKVGMDCGVKAKKALAEIDKAIGGKEDV